MRKVGKIITILCLLAVMAFGITACVENSPTTGDNSPPTTDGQNYVSVTFRQDGQDDIVKLVVSGSTLTDIPRPEPITGYTVLWDRTDFTNITQNITVNAVKTANTYTITYSLGANNYATVESETQEVQYEHSFTLQTPSYQGSAAFYGWYLADENGKVTDEKVENGTYIWAHDICVIAKWQEWSDVVN